MTLSQTKLLSTLRVESAQRPNIDDVPDNRETHRAYRLRLSGKARRTRPIDHSMEGEEKIVGESKPQLAQLGYKH